MAWKKIGSIRKSAKGNLYIKFDESVTLSKDSSIQIQNPRDRIQSLVSSGKLSQAEAETKLSKIPEYIRQDIFLVDKSE